jgi:hypothetical protein
VNVGPHPAADRIRRALRDELVSKAAPDAAVAALLERLAASRLVVLCTSGREAPAAELVHPVLAQQWPRLREWIEADREFLRWRELLNAYRANWERASGTPRLLTPRRSKQPKHGGSRGADLNTRNSSHRPRPGARSSNLTRRWAVSRSWSSACRRWRRLVGATAVRARGQVGSLAGRRRRLVRRRATIGLSSHGAIDGVE